MTGVYEETSGFVHFSDKHIFNALRTVGDTPDDVDADGHNVKMKVSERDDFVPDEAYLAALRAFERITELVGLLVRAYAEQRK